MRNSVLVTSHDDLDTSLKESWDLSRENLGYTLSCYAPSIIKYEVSSFKQSENRVFPAVSVTGSGCDLCCDHCKASILRSMVPATSPKKLVEICEEIASRGGKGCLISGGSTSNGSVPLKRFRDAISYIKKNLNLTVVVHTGLVDHETATQLSNAHIDAALIDIIGENDTIKKVYHLDASTRNYEDSMRYFSNAGVPFVPHVIVGLDHGKVLGESNALKMISKYNPSALVIIVLTPLEGTPMSEVAPPSPTATAAIIAEARHLMPRIPTILGCARPRGEYEADLEILAIKAGVNGIAYPSQEAIEAARQLGLEPRFSEECCAILFRDFSSKKS